MRRIRSKAHGATLIAAMLLLGACGSGVGSGDESPGGGDGGTVAAQLVLGGPPECPKRPFCLPGLKETYGLEFADFKPLDVAGPLTVKALAGGQIDVGVLFSTSSSIVANGFEVLEDDKTLQTAENITPLISEGFPDAAAPLIDEVSAALTTEIITDLNGRVELDQEDPAEVAAGFLQQGGIEPKRVGSGKVTVGAIGFAENQIVAEMYAQVLEEGGYEVDRQEEVGSREILYGAVKSGEVDIAPEYLGSLLLFLEPAADATGDPENNVSLLEPLLEKDGLRLLQYSEANDQNAFVVTKETAEKYGLRTVSDLGEPAP